MRTPCRSLFVHLLLALGCGAPVAPIDAPSPSSDVAADTARDVCVDPPCLRWELGPVMPERRSGHGAVVAHDTTGIAHVLVAGGVDVDLNEDYDYRPGSYRAELHADGSLGAFESWLALPAGLLPGAVSTITVSGREGIVLMSGTTADGAVDLSLIALDGADAWTRLSATLATPRGWAAASGYVEDSGVHFMMIGGIGGAGVSAAVDVTDGATWTSGPPLPTPRAMHRALRHDDHVYVIGGILDEALTPATDILRSTHDGTGALTGWELVGSLDDAPFASGVFVHDGALYVVGGAGTMGPRNDVRRAPIAEDGTLGAFVDVDASLPSAVSDGATFVENGVVYVIGGRGVQQYRSTDRTILGRFVGAE